MRKLSVFSLVCVLFVLSSCSAKQNPDNNTFAVTNDAVDFSFNVPSDWEYIKNDAMVAVQNAQKNANISVTSFEQPKDQSVNDYFEQYKETFKTAFKNMEIVYDNEIKADGIPARRITYTNDLGQDSFKCDMVIMSKNAVLYTVTFTTTPEKYDENVETFNSMLDSFKFK